MTPPSGLLYSRRCSISIPNCSAELRELATDHLRTVDREEIAEEVIWALQGIPPEEVGNRSRRQCCRGYVEPDQVVWELLEEAIQHYLRDIARRPVWE